MKGIGTPTTSASRYGSIYTYRSGHGKAQPAHMASTVTTRPAPLARVTGFHNMTAHDTSDAPRNEYDRFTLVGICHGCDAEMMRAMQREIDRLEAENAAAHKRRIASVQRQVSVLTAGNARIRARLSSQHELTND